MVSTPPIGSVHQRLANNAKRQFLLLDFVSFLVGVRDLESEWVPVVARLKWLVDFDRLDFAATNRAGEREIRTLFTVDDGAAQWTSRGAFDRFTQAGGAAMRVGVDGDAEANLAGFRGLLLMPIRRSNVSYGVLCFVTKEPAGYDAEDEEVVHAAAVHFGSVFDRMEAGRLAARHADALRTMEDLKAFAHSVAHDLRTPLRSIRSFTMALREDAREALQREHLSHLDRVDHAAVRMEELIRALLGFTELGYRPVPLEPVAVRALVEEVIADSQAGRGADAVFEVAGENKVVTANATLLYQVVQNLVNNGLKFVPKDRTPVIRVELETRGGCCRIWIRDNGIGIDPRFHEQIFEVFYRLHDNAEFPGTGVGLAIARRACERMNGRIGVDSKRGAGSDFWVELPLATPAAA